MTPGALLAAGVVMMLVLMTISYIGGLHMGTPMQFPEESSPLVIETEVEAEPEPPEGAWLLLALAEIELLKETIAVHEEMLSLDFDLMGRVKLLERREEEMVSRLRTVVAAAQHPPEKPRYRDLVDHNDELMSGWAVAPYKEDS